MFPQICSSIYVCCSNNMFVNNSHSAKNIKCNNWFLRTNNIIYSLEEYTFLINNKLHAYILVPILFLRLEPILRGSTSTYYRHFGKYECLYLETYNQLFLSSNEIIVFPRYHNCIQFTFFKSN
jgi:hypothetical protein